MKSLWSAVDVAGHLVVITAVMSFLLGLGIITGAGAAWKICSWLFNF